MLCALYKVKKAFALAKAFLIVEIFKYADLLLTSRRTFSRFERIDTHIIDFDVDFTVGRIVTKSRFPLGGRAWEGGANITDGPFSDPLATSAIFNNYLTAATLGDAASFFPESTFGTSKYGLALHDR
jgi:hypothetical protein